MTAAATRGLPTGTVTLLFTDVEGSTDLLRRLGASYGDALERHRSVLREAVRQHGGSEVDTQGDAFFFAFPTAAGAVRGAADAQRGLAAQSWPDDQPVRVRMGVHTGEPDQLGSGYVGLDVHHAARIAAVGHGGQVVVSRSTRDLLGADVALVDLGDHRLKDIDSPIRLFQLCGEGLAADFPPLRSLHASNLPRPATRLVDRAEEAAALQSLLAETRLVTLTGPGGVGKTRLALEVAAGALDAFAGGAYFVDLARITESRLVSGTIAAALGVDGRPGVDRLEQVHRAARRWVADAASDRQRRARARRRPGNRGTARARRARDDPRHEPRALAAPRGAGAAARAPPDRERRRDVHGTRRGRSSWRGARSRGRRRGRGAARRSAALDRARGAARPGTAARRVARAARDATRRALGRLRRRSGAAPGAPRNPRLELRPPRRGRSEGVRLARGLRRWLPARGGRRGARLPVLAADDGSHRSSTRASSRRRAPGRHLAT